jgi:enterochelin esterase-like enzyme
MKLVFSIVYLLCVTHFAYTQQYERYKKLPDTLFQSNALGYSKKLSITVPLEFQSDDSLKSFPLIVIFDSQNQRSYNYILNTIDYLTSNEQIPSAVIIGVESTEEYRYGETQLECSDQSAFGSKNEVFIMDELIPFAEKTLKTIDFNVLIGHSRYGYFTSYLLTKHADQLNAVISMSPFTTEKNVNLSDSIAKLYASYSSRKNLYYRYGIGNDYPDDFNELNEKLNTIQSPSKTANFEGTLFKEADHTVTPGLIIGTALYEIFEFWSKQQNEFTYNDSKNSSSIRVHLDNVEQHYSAKLNFSFGTLNGKGWFFFGEKEYIKAIEAWELMMVSYPNFAEGYFGIMDAKIQLKQDYSETLKKLKECLLTTEFYTEDELIELYKEVAIY